MAESETNNHWPWYREPMVWLVIALPASAVVAGLVTLWIAAKGADSVHNADASSTARQEQAYGNEQTDTAARQRKSSD